MDMNLLLFWWVGDVIYEGKENRAGYNDVYLWKICSGGESKNISNMCGKGRKYCRGIKWMKENGNRNIWGYWSKMGLEYIWYYNLKIVL